jgi:hypothetical protein
MTGSDPEDMPASASLIGKKVGITSLPSKGKLWYNGTQVTVGQDGVTPPSDINPLVITNLDPSLLQFQATGSSYSLASFTYAYIDEASVIDPAPATYTINWNTALPVVLSELDAHGSGCNAVISWESSSEAGLASYEVQHSKTGNDDFLTIATLAPKGNGSQYEVVHAQSGAQGYYRLKMNDHSGVADYSATQIVTIHCNEATKISLHPNPTTGLVHIQGLSAGTRLLVYDFGGRAVISHMADGNATLDLSGLPAGTYQVVVTKADHSVSHRFKVVKQ